IFRVTPAFVTQLLSGNIYANLKTSTLPNGEIRGQLNFTSTLLNTVPRSATTYTDPATGLLTAATLYHYRVVATNQLGDGAFSNIADASTPGRPVLVLANVFSTEIDLSWTRTDNDHYNVERSTDGTNFVALNSDPIPPTVTTYHDTGLVPGTYFYRVRAVNVKPDSQDLSN